MVLENKQSGYSQLLGRTAQTAPTNPPKDEYSLQQPPSKKVKRSEPEESDAEADQRCISPAHPAPRREIPDSEGQSDDEAVEDEAPRASQTDLEQALPPIRTDREAIEEYESMRHAEIVSSSPANGPPSSGPWVKGKSSIYTDSFLMALDTVLDEESHLFNLEEMRVFDSFRSMSYEAQYLYVRLFLRKTSAWFRIESLGYHSDIADLDSAIAELFDLRDLTEHQDKSSHEDFQPPEEYELCSKYTFADSSEDHITSLEEASSLLRLDELKEIAKEAKVQGKNKAELLRSLRRTSGKQIGIGHFGLQRSDTQDSEKSVTPEHRSESPEKRDMSSYNNRDEHFMRKILAQTGKCIRLSLAPFKLFERVHLVFFRSTEWTEKSLITIILARISRRNFPEYIVSRSSNVFPSRSLVLEFEASLRTQFRIDTTLQFNGQPSHENLQWIIDEAFDRVYPRWKVLLSLEQHKEDSIYSSGEGAYLRRLSPAWVYTRIVHKGAWILGLGKFKDHVKEHAILSELLDQRLFHHARRGAWHQRKALLEEHYMAELSPLEGRNLEEQKKHWKRVALRTCEQGLEDSLVHIIYHYDLQKRLLKLEKALKIAKRFQHDFGHALLAKPVERTFTGIRIEKPPPRPSGALQRHSSSGRPGKTIWIDPDPSQPTETHCKVESMCLSHYRALGYKGYHSEGGILRTLFGLLFYDVLFAYVPNVFQTPFQTCPLDLHTDGFYPARASEINAHVAEIGNGCAPRIVREVWEREHERRTCVVGLDWGFEKSDLLEIVETVGGARLAALCKVMAQEYAQRGGGVPDLFLWKTGKKRNEGHDHDDAGDDDESRGECLFAEVKSENDRLSDTQRQWIHVLTGAGFRVELCHAVAGEVRAMG